MNTPENLEKFGLEKSNINDIRKSTSGEVFYVMMHSDKSGLDGEKSYLVDFNDLKDDGKNNLGFLANRQIYKAKQQINPFSEELTSVLNKNIV